MAADAGRHPYSLQAIAVFAVIVVVGYLLIVRRRRWNRRPGARRRPHPTHRARRRGT